MGAKRQITKEQEKFIRANLPTAKSFRELGKKLNKGNQTIVSWCKYLGLDTSHIKKYQEIRDEELIGTKIGLLTLKEIVFHNEKPPGKRKYWRCDCECGTTCEKRADSVVAGRYVSCGCTSRNRYCMVAEKNPAFKGFGEIRSQHFNAIIKSAKHRNLEFDLDIEYVWDLYLKQNKKCALTGLEIYFGRVHYRYETTASLDRIDSSKGYLKGNVQWVLKDINLIKQGYDNEYFIKLCNHVALTNPRDDLILPQQGEEVGRRKLGNKTKYDENSGLFKYNETRRQKLAS